jgi:predicted nucleic acid-binding protein
MVRILVDTNILLRLSDDGSPDQAVAEQALSILRLRGDIPCLTPQNIIEFWAVATRPVKANGFGWTTQRTATEVEQLQNKFPILSDSPLIFSNWLTLATTHDVKGKQVHDTRLVAVMMAHGITHLLTFNTDDFRRFPNITLRHPNEVA